MKYQSSFINTVLSSSRWRWRRRTRTQERVLEEPELLVYTPTSTRRLPSMAQWTYMNIVLSRRERILFWVSIVLLLASALTFATRWYHRSTIVIPRVGSEYTEGFIGTPQFINPILSPLSDVDADLSKIVFSSIFTYNDRQELVPDVITNYTEAEDHLTYTFYVRPNIEWHDGEPLTADDVLFTISAIQDPQYQSPLYGSLAGVQTNKIDDYTFSLTLKEPFAPFLSLLTFGILPQHLWFDVPPQNASLTELNLRPIGSGPYIFDALTKDKAGNIKSFRFVRNTEYYGTQPKIAVFNAVFYIDRETALQALKSKKVEGLSFIPHADKAEVAKKNGNIQFYSLRLPQYTAVFFNQKRSPLLQSRVVREALSRAVDRDAMVRDVLGGEGEPIYTPILPGFLGHHPDVEKYPLNLDDANRLLEDDGWKYPTPPEGETQTEFAPREKDGTKLEFTLTVADASEYQFVAEQLTLNWQKIGARVTIQPVSAENIQSDVIKKREYDALLFGAIIGTDPDPYPFWHSSQQDHPGVGLAIFRDRKVDQLLEEARKITNPDERKTKYVDFQNLLAQDIPAIFLYNPYYTYGVHKKVHGISKDQYITVPADRFSQITQWYSKTSRQWR